MAGSTITKSTGAVVFLDALGIKGSWLNAEAILNLWDEFNEVMARVANDMSNEPYSDHGMRIENYSFSDTFIVTATVSDKNNFELINLLGYILSDILLSAFFHKLYLRGCISFGDYYVSSKKRMLIGPAIDEAAQYYNTSEWLGVSLAPSAHSIVSDWAEKQSIEESYFLRYAIPVKGGVEGDGIAVNWLIYALEKQIVGKLKERLRHKIRSATEIPVAFKYRNTLSFCEFAELNTPPSTNNRS